MCIGRHPASDLPLTWDAGASRLHADLERIAGEWTVVDDGRARNGTFVNERRVRGRTLLIDGDVIRIGHTLLTFRAPLMAGASTTATPGGRPVTVSAAQRRVLVSLCRPIVEATSFATPASNRQIATELVVSLETVRTHIRHLLEELEIKPAPPNQKRAALAHAAIQRGVVTQRGFSARTEQRIALSPLDGMVGEALRGT